MSTKTKIVVIRKKHLILIGIIILLLIILTLLLTSRLGSKEDAKVEDAVPSSYQPGVYTSTVMLNDTAMDVQVVVDEDHINSIALVNIDESIETMYPLVRPAMEDLSNQILQTQSVDSVTYPQSNPYTSMVLHEAIRSALSKSQASIP